MSESIQQISHSNTKRIAKNTIMLYFRMMLLMCLSLYTSRVILRVLGVEDFGINSVIAGFVSMFSIITGSMSSAISRFITVELGKGNANRLRAVFSTSISVQLFLGLLIIVLLETFGLWFVENRMQIPEGREIAAQWCLHCTSLTTFITLMNVPFNSAIIAHEKMSAFAYMTILDAVLKFLICYTLYISPIDKLVTYAILGTCVSAITTSIYWIYSLRKFEETSFKFKLNGTLFREMWGFAGWNLLGQTSWVLNNQGINMLMNLFFGVVINAARGVAVQVNHVLNQFVSNFMMALNPQITKSYAAGDKEAAFALACRGCRFSFYILLMLALPIMIESEQIIKLWLGTPPDQASTFVVWTILSSFCMLLGNTLVTLQFAHGNIRNYQIWITITGCLPFPLSWIAFKLGAQPIVSYYIYTIVYWMLIFVRFFLVRSMTGIPSRMYLLDVVGRTHLVALVSSIVPLLLFCIMEETLIRLISIVLTSFVITAVVIYSFGINPEERTFINSKILRR